MTGRRTLLRFVPVGVVVLVAGLGSSCSSNPPLNDKYEPEHRAAVQAVADAIIVDPTPSSVTPWICVDGPFSQQSRHCGWRASVGYPPGTEREAVRKHLLERGWSAIRVGHDAKKDAYVKVIDGRNTCIDVWTTPPISASITVGPTCESV